MIKIEEGMVLLQNTCDEIKIGIRGEVQRINEHIEHWLIKDIKKDNVILYNLDTGSEWKLNKQSLEILMTDIWKGKINAILTISNEKA